MGKDTTREANKHAEVGECGHGVDEHKGGSMACLSGNESDNEGNGEEEEEPWEGEDEQYSEENENNEEQEDENDDEEDEDDPDSEVDDDSHQRHIIMQMQQLYGNSLEEMKRRLQSILKVLTSGDDPMMQLGALDELAELLSVSSEDTLATVFSTDKFVVELVRIMKGTSHMLEMAMDDDVMMSLALSGSLGEDNPEIMLLACRCISNLLDVMPTSVRSVVDHEAVKVLCQKLKSIEYIDLAEQAILALEKVSLRMPRAVVREGGIGAALAYFDFFSIHSQRTALSTAANCLRNADTSMFEHVTEILPTLMNTITYPDRSVVDLTCLCWVRLAEGYRGNRPCIEQMISVDLLKTLIDLMPVPGNSRAVSPHTFVYLLRILRSVSKSSPQLAYSMLELDIIGKLGQVLTGSTSEDASTKPATLDSKWRDSTHAMLKIMADLVPSLPKDSMFSSRRFKDTDDVRASVHINDQPKSKKVPELDPRVSLLRENQSLLQHADRILIPILLEIYASNINMRVRQMIVHALVKFIYYSDPDTLKSVLESIPMSSFVASALSQQENEPITIDALYLVELLTNRLPDIYHSLFQREGVLHEIEQLKIPAPSPGNDLEATTSGVSSPSKNVNVELNIHTQNGGETSEKAAVGDMAIRDGFQSELEKALRGRLERLEATGGDVNRGDVNRVEMSKTRLYITRLANSICERLKVGPPGESFLQDMENLAEALKGTTTDPTATETLKTLRSKLEASSIGISSYELLHSDLMDVFLDYLTSEKSSWKAPIHDRQEAFKCVFVVQGQTTLVRLVERLQEIMNRWEQLEVVSPLEATLDDHFQNPVSILAKQIRIELHARGTDTSNDSGIMMVSAQAVATFKTLEDFLLTRVFETDNLPERLFRFKRPSELADAQEEEGEEDQDEEKDEDEGEDEGEEEGEDEEEDENEDEDEVRSSTSGQVDVLPATESDESAMDLEELPSEPNGDETEPEPSSSTSPRSTEWQIKFYYRGIPIRRDETVYGLLHRYEMQHPGSISSGGGVWHRSHTISYKRVKIPSIENEEPAVMPFTSDPPQDKIKDDKEKIMEKALQLLKALSELCKQTPIHFVNRHLTAKVNWQLEEPLIVATKCLPTWIYRLVREAPFLFPFETRYLFIQSTSFDCARMVTRWQSQQTRDHRQRGRDDAEQQVLGHIERKKVRIMRERMLDSAIKILELFADSRAMLDVEYLNEVGTGLGPTLEFYAATSREFCQPSLGLWRHEETDGAAALLFPRSISTRDMSTNTMRVVQLFHTLGQLVARSLFDFRILDIPLHPAFFDVVFGRVRPGIPLITSIDPILCKSLERLQKLVLEKKALYAQELDTNEITTLMKQLTVDGVSMQDLCLDFTVPGQALELKFGGADIPVTIYNVDEYLDLVVDAMVGSGIERQVQAFREGFNQLFPLDDLSLLSSEELAQLCGTAEEDWSLPTLSDAIKADHGYTATCPTFQRLLETLSELNHDEQRAFLQFTTGSPRLPWGGWRAMQPPFTAVRKGCDSPHKPDDYLPSVMTCANYLKLPDYSSKDVLRRRLLTSIREGKDSFLLS